MPPRGSNPPPSKSRRRPSPPVSGAWIWMIIGLALVAMLLFGTFDNRIELPYSPFLRLLEKDPGKLEKLSFGNNERIFGELKKDRSPLQGDSELEDAEKKFAAKRTQKFVTRRWSLEDPQFARDLSAIIKQNNIRVDAP